MATLVEAPEVQSPRAVSTRERIGAEKPTEYLFIHTVRYWAIVGIVLMHCADGVRKAGPVSWSEILLMVQPFKFGTIAFFMISGFLVGDRLPASNPMKYLGRRANRLFPAWTTWFVLWVSYTTQRDLRAHGGAISPGLFASTLWTDAVNCLIATPLWYVPNFFVALTCLVMFRKRLNDLWVGALFLAISMFYTVNVYTCWIPSRHTEAVFGFVFYLWLGAWFALHKDRFQAWLKRRSYWELLFCSGVAAGIAVCETFFLAARHNPDPVNSLRFGNQIYSVFIFLVLAKIPRRTWPEWVNVAETTFGVHLSHPIMINLVLPIGMGVVLAHGHKPGTAGYLLIWALVAPVGYFLSLQLTRAIASSSRWSWVVGAARFEPSKWKRSAGFTGASVGRATEA